MASPTGLSPRAIGGYINFQQQVSSSLTVFLNVVIADKRTATQCDLQRCLTE